MLSLSGGRSLAISVMGLALGWWGTMDDATILAHYQSLSYDALIKELATKYDGRLTPNLAGGVFVVLVIVIAVDLLTKLFDRAWLRLGGSPPPGEVKP